MKSPIAFLSVAAVIALSSCSSAYRTAQTPDDIYFSPEREPADSYVQTDRSPMKPGSYQAGSSQGDYYTREDNVLRMRVRNRQMWGAFDDYGYGGMGMGYGMGYGGMGMGYGMSPWAFNNGFGMGSGLGWGYGSGLGMGWGGMSPWGWGGMNNWGWGGMNPWMGSGIGWGGYGMGMGLGYGGYYGWNHFYNPYFPGGVAIGGGNKPIGPNTRVRSFNPSGYSNRTYNSSNVNRTGATRPGTYRPQGQNGYNNTNTLGTSIRRAFSSGGNNSNSGASRGSYYSPNNDRPTRSYQPAQSAPVRTQSMGTSGGSTGGGGGSTGGGGGSVGGRPGRN